MILLSALSFLLFPACTGGKGCEDGYTLQQDGTCAADSGDTASADTDTDTDADTDTDTTTPIVISLSGTLALTDGTISDAAKCDISLWGASQIDASTGHPSHEETPLAGAQPACPTVDGGSVAWELPDADTQGALTVYVFATVDPDGDTTTRDSAGVGSATNPLAVVTGGSYPGIDLTIDLTTGH